MKLLRLLSIVSRRRWPEFADPAPAIGVPPPKKKTPPRTYPWCPSRAPELARLSSDRTRTTGRSRDAVTDPARARTSASG